jgi:hypothetical protein
MPASDSVHIARLKAKAKVLHRAVKAADEAALAHIRPYFQEPGNFKLSHAQLVVARQLRFSSWRQLAAKKDWVSCSFCRKGEYELRKLIAGPDGVFVCDECVEFCHAIIRQ